MSYIGQAPGLGQRTAFRFVANPGQTTFSGPDANGYPLGYTPGLVDIYLNGRLLSEPDVTAADGSTIIIASPLNINDELRVLAQAPFSPANTYTMTQADSFQRRRNRVVDPGMRVSQENGNNALTAAGPGVLNYASDSFSGYRNTTAGTYSVQRIALTTPGGSPYRVRITVTGANASPAANDQLLFRTVIEGVDVADLKFGTAQARTIAVRFGCRASVAGTYTVNVGNAYTNRSWLGAITITSAEVGVDVVKSVTLVGDQTGTWTTDNTAGLVLCVTMCAGTTYQGSIGWQGGSPYGLTSQTNLMATNGATFDLFDVGLYDVTGLQAGVIPPFELGSYIEDLIKCQRYYAKTYSIDVIPNSNSSEGVLAHTVEATCFYPSLTWEFPVTMRTVPSVIIYGSTGGSGSIYNINSGSNLPAYPSYAGLRRCTYNVNNTSVGVNNTISAHSTANARL